MESPSLKILKPNRTQPEGAKTMDPGSSWWCPVTAQEAMAKTKVAPSEDAETLFCCEGDGAMAQASQTSHGPA